MENADGIPSSSARRTRRRRQVDTIERAVQTGWEIPMESALAVEREVDEFFSERRCEGRFSCIC